MGKGNNPVLIDSQTTTFGLMIFFSIKKGDRKLIFCTDLGAWGFKKLENIKTQKKYKLINNFSLLQLFGLKEDLD